MNLELNTQEAQALHALIDFAVKAQGLLVAETALVLVKKMQAAAAKEAEPKVEPEPDAN